MYIGSSTPSGSAAGVRLNANGNLSGGQNPANGKGWQINQDGSSSFNVVTASNMTANTITANDLTANNGG